PLHHPARVAEEWSLVDNLSNGRVGISVASGWQPNDFVLRPENFATAKKDLYDQIETVRSLWRGEAVPFAGPDGKPVETRTLPRPIQPELPIWVTSAGSPETFASAGRIGANVLTHLLGQTVEEVAERIAAYRAAWTEAGHPGRGQVSIMLHTFIGDDEASVRETVRRPMMNYLASSVGLIKGFAGAWTAYKKRSDGTTDAQVDLSALSDEDMEDLVAYSFERYFDSSALFGTPEHCLALIQQLQAAGVDDIACLIDFGVASETVLAHLPRLKELKEMAQLAPSVAPDEVVAGEDYRLPAQMSRHGVTHLQCTPSMARMITLDPEARGAVKDLEAFMIGGEALPLSLAEEVASLTSARLLNMYGPTETTIWSSTETIAPGADAVTIGRPIANNQLYVLDADGNPAPAGVAGELYIGGDGVVRGYLGRPELTAERFLPDPFRDACHGSDAPARIYRTGDLARWREDGRMEFIGRVDHQVKMRGYRIELGEIEALLNAHAEVREAVVIPREDEEGDQRLVAYLIPQEGREPGSQALRDHLREKLPDFMVPSHFVCLDEFPQTPNRKVDRKALPDPAELAARAPAVHRKPENEVEETIARIWQEVLRIPQVGREDNFFDLGGHSLLALKTHRQIVAELDASDLKITDLFRFPTVRALAGHLSDADAGPSLQQSQDRADARRDAMARRRASRG
ncbi:MAG: LLM class flavin-dependent oxidoreductase, partial [Myxococcales bacterium]|nr:LLM class flavin-dependent oxidoreductase [Myxococcales bacterium]